VRKREFKPNDHRLRRSVVPIESFGRDGGWRSNDGVSKGILHARDFLRESQIGEIGERNRSTLSARLTLTEMA
jgi:hypothetical protein